MPSREFVDADGIEWTVWSVTPGDMSVTLSRLTGLTGERRLPWLVFQASTGEKRRLVPPPPGWEHTDDEGLALLAIQAVPAPPAPARRSKDQDTPPLPPDA